MNIIKLLSFFFGIFFLFNFQNKLVAQKKNCTKEQIQIALKNAFEKNKNIQEGKNANYIPYLEKVPSNLFGICIVTKDGNIYSIGDTKFEFGIESVSKIFVLALAVKENGWDIIQNKIGLGNTGFPFHSVLGIELQGKKAIHPLNNAGAMAVNSLIKGETPNAQFEKILLFFNTLANRKLSVIKDLYESESSTNTHNQGIALLLKSYNALWSNPLDACDSYTKQCSVGVNAEDLAMMGSVLSNNGIHPITKQVIIDSHHIAKLLSVMAMGGIYEKSGEWLFEVGLPAKNGVGGAILAVVPNQFAIVGFAPPLDESGNSIKAKKAIQSIAKELQLSIFQ